MDGEPRQTNASDDPVAAEVSEAVERWLSETAADLGLSREELVRNLLAEVRHAEANGTAPDVSSRIDALEDDVARKIEDVRDRVVQVKLEADEKAPADHEHPDLQGRLEQVASASKQAADQIEDMQDSLADLESRTESGFENYETILDELVDTTEEVEEKLNTLAAAVLNVRESVSDLEERTAGGTSVAALMETANRHGIDAADCDECGKSVQIGLLSEPTCPHCSAGIDDLEPRGGWLRSSVLLTTERPALSGEAAEGEDRLDAESEDLEEIDGLGPTAATNIRESGIETIGELAGADPGTLSAATSLPEDRVGRWIEQAKGRIDGTDPTGA